jgi:hypothetical protein
MQLVGFLVFLFDLDDLLEELQSEEIRFFSAKRARDGGH